MPDIKQSLRDFVATSNSGKYKSEQELLSKFPEFKDYDIQLLRDFVATSNSGKYKTEAELLSKFPEFYTQPARQQVPASIAKPVPSTVAKPVPTQAQPQQQPNVGERIVQAEVGKAQLEQPQDTPQPKQPTVMQGFRDITKPVQADKIETVPQPKATPQQAPATWQQATDIAVTETNPDITFEQFQQKRQAQQPFSLGGMLKSDKQKAFEQESEMLKRYADVYDFNAQQAATNFQSKFGLSIDNAQTLETELQPFFTKQNQIDAELKGYEAQWQQASAIPDEAARSAAQDRIKAEFNVKVGELNTLEAQYKDKLDAYRFYADSPEYSIYKDLKGKSTEAKNRRAQLPLDERYKDVTQDIGELEGLANAYTRGMQNAEIADILSAGRQPTTEELRRIAQLKREQEGYKVSDAVERFNNASGFKESAKAFLSNPFEITSQWVTESLVAQMSHGITRAGAGAGMGAAIGTVVPVIGTAAGAGTGFIAGMGMAGFNLEYSSSILESLQEAGIDITNEDSLINGFSDANKMKQAKEFALKRGVPISVFDMVTGGIGGKIAKAPIKSAFKKGVAEFGTEMVGAGGGEVAAQLISKGEISGKEVFAEMMGEIGAGAPTVAVNNLVALKQKASGLKGKEKTDVEAQIVEQAVQTDVPVETFNEVVNLHEGAGLIEPQAADELKSQYEQAQANKPVKTMQDELQVGDTVEMSPEVTAPTEVVAEDIKPLIDVVKDESISGGGGDDDATVSINNRQQEIERQKAYIEIRKQKELDTNTSAGYGIIASDYLFTGGIGAMLSTDYLLQALTASFPFAGKQIDDIRKKYASKLGNILDDINSKSYNEAIQEIRSAINSTYQNSEIESLFNEILNNSTGFIPREGNRVSARLEALNDEHENKIKAKYDAELAALEQEQVITEPIKTEEDAEEQQSGQMRVEGEQRQTEGASDSDMPSVNEAGLPIGQAIEEEIKPVTDEKAEQAVQEPLLEGVRDGGAKAEAGQESPELRAQKEEVVEERFTVNKTDYIKRGDEYFSKPSKGKEKPITQKVFENAKAKVKQADERTTPAPKAEVKEVDVSKAESQVETDKADTESNPALSSVEATAKALEGVDRDMAHNLTNWTLEKSKRLKELQDKEDDETISKSEKVEFDVLMDEFDLVNEDKLDEANIKALGFLADVPHSKNTPKSISEAYHKAKADGTNPELVQAVEELLGKEQPSPSVQAQPQATDVEATAKALEGVYINTPRKYYPDDIAVFNFEGKDFDVNVRGYDTSGKVVVFGKRGSGIGQIMVEENQLKPKIDKSKPKTNTENNELVIASMPLDKYLLSEYGGDDKSLINELTKERQMAIDSVVRNPRLSKDVSEAYHKAKADGTNPELVQAVEELLGQRPSPTVQAQQQATDVATIFESVAQAYADMKNMKPKDARAKKAEIKETLKANPKADFIFTNWNKLKKQLKFTTKGDCP